MLPATTPGVTASCEATSRRRASREIRLATISTTWQKRPASSDSLSGFRGTSSSELVPYDLGSLDHGTQLGEGHFLGKVQAATIRQNKNTFCRNKFQGLANTLGNDFRSLDLVCLYV